MQRPVYLGAEVELCTTYNQGVPPIAQADRDGSFFLRNATGKLVHWPERHAGFLLRNGGCVYDEVGDHVEYASPEYESALDLVLTTRAAELLLHNLMREAREELILQEETQGLAQEIPEVRMNCRSIAPMDRSEDLAGSLSNRFALFAFHENYDVSQWPRVPERLLDIVGIHTLSRTVFGGAGCVLYGLPRISGRVGLLRLNNHSNSDFWPRIHSTGVLSPQRLEVRQGENQPSDYARFLKIASTSLIIIAYRISNQLRTNALLDKISCSSNSLVELNNQTNPNKTIRNHLGKKVSLLDIQEHILSYVSDTLRGQSVLDDEQMFALSEWRSILEDLRKGSVDPYDGRVDWLGRLQFWEDTKAHKPQGINSSDICFSYDDLMRGKGIKRNGLNMERIGMDAYKADVGATPSEPAYDRVAAALSGDKWHPWSR